MFHFHDCWRKSNRKLMNLIFFGELTVVCWFDFGKGLDLKVALIFVGVIIEAAAYRKNVRSIGSETSHPKPMVYIFVDDTWEVSPWRCDVTRRSWRNSFTDGSLKDRWIFPANERVFPCFPVGVITQMYTIIDRRWGSVHGGSQVT